LTEEVAGEIVEEELTLEEALAELEAEAALATVGEILLILGPVLVLFVGFFGSRVCKNASSVNISSRPSTGSANETLHSKYRPNPGHPIS
jgi:hypothetical protein